MFIEFLYLNLAFCDGEMTRVEHKGRAWMCVYRIRKKCRELKQLDAMLDRCMRFGCIRDVCYDIQCEDEYLVMNE